jgi:hypothetical protein
MILDFLIIKFNPTFNMWVAESLDYDIGSQGSTRKEAMENLYISLCVDLQWSIEDNGIPFGGIPVSPQKTAPEKIKELEGFRSRGYDISTVEIVQLDLWPLIMDYCEQWRKYKSKTRKKEFNFIGKKCHWITN